MATDNKQKVLIRSMSYDEVKNYLCTSDLNGKIIPKNENTWHQKNTKLSPGGGQYFGSDFFAAILLNLNKTNNLSFYVERETTTTGKYFSFIYAHKKQTILDSGYSFYSFPNQMYSHSLSGMPVFRPLIEYKE